MVKNLNKREFFSWKSGKWKVERG